MRPIFGVVSVLAALFMTEVSARTVAECNNCEQSEAEEVAARLPTVGSVTRVAILDYVREFAWACDLFREPGVPEPTAVCVPGPATAQSAFTTIARGVAQLKADVISIPHPSGNIFELSGCTACVDQWLRDNRYAVAGRVSLLDLIAAQGIQLSVSLGVAVLDVQASYIGRTELRIELANDIAAQNGRKAYCMARITSDRIVIDADRCFDSDGNPIPTLAAPNLQIRYMFSSTANLVGMMGRLAAIGRPVRGTGVATVGDIIECTANECTRRSGNR